MEKRTTRTTDEDIRISLKKKEPEKPIHTTDEEITIEWVYKDHRITHHPKDYEEIEY
ncbi:hypothetical protein [Anoxybacteroides tepidamans]|uniref:hypothetical protein n=1 Tax=Anoxybacteroides tepidamans TaxID=265948 RepID=UPI000B16554D|nr:hypothetical protein [Anoxybacillus tepidamans]